MKKILALILCTLMATFAFSSTLVSAANSTANPVQVNWITWSYTADKDIMDSIVKTAKEKMNIDLSINNYPTDQYENTIRVKFSSGELDDIIGVHGVQSLYGNMLAKNGALADISKSSVLKDYLPVASEYAKLNGKQYYIANSGAVLGAFYNKKIFKDLKLSIPTNRSQFNTLCEKIKASKLIPIANGFKDGWTVQITPMISIAQAYQTSDHNALQNLTAGSIKYNTPKMVSVLDPIVDFAKRGYYGDKFVGQDFLTAASLVANGKAAMMINGNWVYKNITDANKNADIGFFALPLVNAGEKITLPGSFEGGIALNAKSKVLDSTKKIWDYYYSTDIQQKYTDTGAILPTNKNVKVNAPITKEIQNVMNQVGYVTPAWFGTFQPAGMQDLMIKDLQVSIAKLESTKSVADDMENFNKKAIATAKDKK